ncbi:MAG: polyisoprenoid-binding protein YceI [Ulvibacter sp.]|jgi:polyisoprenoid-binding protein YceI
MKKTLFLFFIACSQVIIAQNIVVNEDKATVDFLFLDDDVDGTLSDFKFTGSLDFNALETSTLSGTVATETIDTDNWLRNRHLRNKYFKSDDFPLLKFKSDSISAEGDSFIVNGVLTIKGISKIVSFRFSKTSNLLTGKASMNASDFDINIHDETSRNKLTITIVLPYSN